MKTGRLVALSALGGAAVAGLAALGIAAFVIANGWYDVSASSGHSRLVATILHTTMIHSVQHYARNEPFPAQFSEAEIRDGFRAYETHCVMCHGAPGVARAPWAGDMTPDPPYLLDSARRWSPTELRYIIANGVKMTAMPAWKLSEPPQEISALAAFVETLPDLTPAQYARMRAAARAVHACGERGCGSED